MKMDTHLICSIPTLNTSRDGSLFENKQDIENLASSLAGGWWGDQVIEICKIDDSIDLPDRHPLDRPADGDYTIIIGDEKIVVDQFSLKTYIQAHQTQPKWFVNDGGRRIAVLPLANLVREKAGLPPIVEVPVRKGQYKDEVDREIANLAANSTAGKRGLLITRAALMLVASMKEKRFMSMADIASALRLDKRRQRGLIQGLDYGTELMLRVEAFADLADKVKAGEYRAPGSYLSKMVNGINNRRRGKPTIKEGFSLNDVETALRPLDKGGKRQSRTMSKGDLESMVQDHPCTYARDLTNAIVTNDRDSIEDLHKYNRVINAVVYLLDAGIPESDIKAALQPLHDKAAEAANKTEAEAEAEAEAAEAAE